MPFCEGFLSSNSEANWEIVISLVTLGNKSTSRTLHWGDEVQTEPSPSWSRKYCLFLLDVPVAKGSLWSNSRLSCTLLKESVMRGRNLGKIRTIIESNGKLFKWIMIYGITFHMQVTMWKRWFVSISFTISAESNRNLSFHDYLVTTASRNIPRILYVVTGGCTLSWKYHRTRSDDTKSDGRIYVCHHEEKLNSWHNRRNPITSSMIVHSSSRLELKTEPRTKKQHGRTGIYSYHSIRTL